MIRSMQKFSKSPKRLEFQIIKEKLISSFKASYINIEINANDAGRIILIIIV